MTNSLDIAIDRFKEKLAAQRLNDCAKATWKEAYLNKIDIKKQSINSESYRLQHG
jgi:glycerate kinase